MPRARSRRSAPTLPGSSRSSSPSCSAASAPIVAIPAAARRSSALRADAGQQPDVERGEELRLPTGRHHRQPTRLAPVARDLRHHLAGRDAERAGEARRCPHRRLHRLRDRPRSREVPGQLARRRGSPRRSPPARRSDTPPAPPATPSPSRPDRSGGAASRTPRRGSGAAPRRSSSRSGCRSGAPRSWRSRRRRAPGDRRRRRAAGRAAPAARAPPPPRRTRRDRGGRRSSAACGS